MKKDVLVALIIGFSIGALIALLAVRLPALLEKSESSKETTAEKVEPTPKVIVGKNEVKLEVTSPTDKSIVTEDKITISGKTDATNTLIMETPDESKILEPDKDGKFSADLTLNEGGNSIYLTAVNDQGEETAKTLTLFYTTEKL